MMPHPAKLPTATYESEMKPDSAWIYLNQIPDDNAENTAFKELYTQLLNGIEPPAGSGKTMSTQELYLHQSALQEQTLYAPIAQAINASYFGEVYYKNVALKQKRAVENIADRSSNFRIQPNPVNNIAIMRLDNQIGEIWELQVYDLFGVLQLTYPCNSKNCMLQIDLPNGMYICRAIANAQIVGTQKLFVIK